MSDSDDTRNARGKGSDPPLSAAESRFFCNIVMNLSSKADIDVSKAQGISMFTVASCHTLTDVNSGRKWLLPQVSRMLVSQRWVGLHSDDLSHWASVRIEFVWQGQQWMAVRHFLLSSYPD
jgi:hypothetical protein